MDEPIAKATNGRDPKTGRLLPGHKVSLGNRVASRRLQLTAAAMSAVTKEDVAGVFRKALTLALGGNVQAMRFLADYLCIPAPKDINIQADVSQTTRQWTLQDLIEFAKLRQANPQIESHEQNTQP